MVTATLLSRGKMCSSGEKAAVFMNMNGFELDCEVRFFEDPKWETDMGYNVELYFE